MNAPFSQDLLNQLPVVGILRGCSDAEVEQIVLAAIRGGLKNLEITMNSPNACGQIRKASELAEGRMNIGAGTVLNLELLDQALSAGASFIVTPTVTELVINECVSRMIPVFPGALSPTEIVRAWELGATMVKIFPAESLGPGFIRALKAPLPAVKLLPTGGVDLKTMPDFLKAGADGFGVGSPLFRPDRIHAEDWNWVELQCRAFALAYAEARVSFPQL
jgi:2-dehydro-3-deoxyphosphogluconate aldolase / (4S)-4-hydroxy-2-oxoglutarate aldolase